MERKSKYLIQAIAIIVVVMMPSQMIYRMYPSFMAGFIPGAIALFAFNIIYSKYLEDESRNESDEEES
jgi:hypothetical protein